MDLRFPELGSAARDAPIEAAPYQCSHDQTRYGYWMRLSEVCESCGSFRLYACGADRTLSRWRSAEEYTQEALRQELD